MKSCSREESPRRTPSTVAATARAGATGVTRCGGHLSKELDDDDDDDDGDEDADDDDGEDDDDDGGENGDGDDDDDDDGS